MIGTLDWGVAEKLNYSFPNNIKQGETDPSRRHIKGSKIAKGLHSAKVLVNWGPFDEKFFMKKMSHNAEKTQRGDPLVSPGIVGYAEKKENPFGFSSLGQ